MTTRVTPIDTLIFLHLPKTAGSSILTVLRKHYKQHERYELYGTPEDPSGNYDRFYDLSEDHKRQIKCICGHIGFGVHEHLPQRAMYTAVLRSPVERMISSYYFDGTIPFGPFYELIRSGQFSLTDYVQHFTNVDTDNLQTRMVAGNWDKKGEGPCTPEMLEQAKRNLREKFVAVGITTHTEDFYILLAQEMKWWLRLMRRDNVNARRPQRTAVSEEELAFVRQHNLYDEQLYEYATTLFFERREQAGVSFQLKKGLYYPRQRPYQVGMMYAHRLLQAVRGES